MEVLSLEEIVKATNGQIITPGKPVTVTGVSVDSRSLCASDVFFALKGINNDGHMFISEAMGKGAAGAVVSYTEGTGHMHEYFPLIKVADTTRALGDLAKYYRRKLNTKIIGITGSNGKTTTKEMAYHLLSQFGPAVRSRKSYNNFIGVPLTIFETESRYRYSIVEMGTNSRGEISRLAEIVAPDIAVITNISKTHLGGLGSIEGVAEEKKGILDHMNGGRVFVYNADDPLCARIASEFTGEKISFGFGSHAHVRANDICRVDGGYSFFLNKSLKIHLSVHGIHNIINCLASFAVCYALGKDIFSLKDAFSDFKLPPMRMEQHHFGNITIINDAYNANPLSVYAALEYLREINPAGRRVFICGDMLELGEETAALHREIGRAVAGSGIDLLWTVGEHAVEVAKAAMSSGMEERQIFHFKNLQDIEANSIRKIKEHDTVLIKGSRGMKMELLLEKFKNLLQ